LPTSSRWAPITTLPTYPRQTGPLTPEGAFRALNDWKIGNDPDTVNGIPASLSFFKYVGHAYDGIGSGSDGIADGKVSHTFTDLAAGDYSVFMGGSDYLAQSSSNPNLLSKYGVTGTLTAGVVPEPETYAMLLAGLGVIGVSSGVAKWQLEFNA
jgi:hypothetical protein